MVKSKVIDKNSLGNPFPYSIKRGDVNIVHYWLAITPGISRGWYFV